MKIKPIIIMKSNETILVIIIIENINENNIE
jgi:hypothetical protein